MWDPFALFETATLSNGLTVYAAHWPGREWQAVNILVHAGSRNDPQGREGVAHFVEHMVSQNNRWGAKKIEELFDDWGGDVYLGGTSTHSSKYEFVIPIQKEMLRQAFTIFGEMLLESKLTEKLERERQVIISEYRRRYPLNVIRYLGELKHRMIYAGTWLEHSLDPLGTLRSIGEITANDLQTFYDTHYTPANMTMLFVGGLTISQIVEQLTDSPFGKDKPGTRVPHPKLRTNIWSPQETKRVVELSKLHQSVEKDVAHYTSTAVLPGTTSPLVRHIACNMCRKALMEELRERRAWAYDVDVQRNQYIEFWECVINVPGIPLGAAEEIESVVDTVIDSLLHNEELFEKTRRQEIANYTLFDRLGRDICSDAAYEILHARRITTLEEQIAELKQMKMSDVCQMLEGLRPSQRWTLIKKP